MRRLDRCYQALGIGSEAAMQRFFESYPRPLHVIFNAGWNGYFAIPQLQFGADYRADFVVLSAHSGAWIATFIELESPQARLYLKDGTESRCLRTAIRQLKDWARWVETDRTRLVQALRRGIRLANAKGFEIEENPVAMGAGGLFDPETVILPEYGVVIGRSRELTKEENARRSLEHRGPLGIRIVTYDRVIETLQRDLRGFREARHARLAHLRRWKE